MKILCVEDGSVDLDELKDGRLLVYRQGSKPPFILEIDDVSVSTPAPSSSELSNDTVIKELNETILKLKSMKDQYKFDTRYSLINDLIWYFTERLKLYGGNDE